MKHKTKKIICLFFACFISVFISMSGAVAIGPQKALDSYDLAEEYVMNQVSKFISVNDEDNTIVWSEETHIKSCTKLYAPDDSVNGYIFRFETSGVDTGFMQIGILEQKFFIVNLGFEGNDVLTKMIATYSASDLSFMTSNLESEVFSDLSRKEISKVYYTGNFNYYISVPENKIVDILNGEIKEVSATNLSSEYERYKVALGRYETDQSIDVNATSSSKIIPSLDTILLLQI